MRVMKNVIYANSKYFNNYFLINTMEVTFKDSN